MTVSVAATMSRASLAVALLACALPLVVETQTPVSGSIKGCVTDSDRTGVPGVSVRVMAAGTEMQAVTAGNGCYAVKDVRAGKARIVAELTGFLTQVRESFSVRPGREHRVDFKNFRPDLSKSSWPQSVLSATDLSVPCPADPSLFIPVSVDRDPEWDTHRKDWFTKHVRAAGEEPLCVGGAGAERYRFVWLRSFDSPVIVRIDIDGATGAIVGKTLSGQGGYEPGVVAETRTLRLNDKQVKSVRKRKDDFNFWRQPTMDTEPINLVNVDGAHWLLEAAVRGRYHLVDRWSDRNKRLQRVCLEMVKLTGMRIPGPIY